MSLTKSKGLDRTAAQEAEEREEFLRGSSFDKGGSARFSTRAGLDVSRIETLDLVRIISIFLSSLCSLT